MKTINLLLVLVGLAYTNNSFSLGRSHDEAVQESLQRLKILENSHFILKLAGEQHLRHFQENYILPFNIKNSRERSIGEILSSYEVSSTPPIFDINSATQTVNQFLNFIQTNDYITIVLDGEKDQKILYRSMMLYAIGLMYNLEYLHRVDISHSEEIRGLKRILLTRLSPFFKDYKQAPDNVKTWERIYFALSYAAQSNFPVDIIEDIGHQLSQLASQESLSSPERQAASTLLLELTLMCNSRCTKPLMESYGNFERTTNDHLKNIFSICDRGCNRSRFNMHAAGFYRAYLSLLRRTNDPALEPLREKLILIDLKHIPIQLRDNWNGYVQNHYNSHFIKEFFFIIGRGMQLSTAAILLIIPLWIFFLVTGLFLLMFTGKNKVRFSYSSLPTNTQKGFKRLLIRFLFEIVRWLKSVILLIRNLVRALYQNIIKSYTDDHTVTYRIGTDLTLVSITLLISEVRSFIDLSY